MHLSCSWRCSWSVVRTAFLLLELLLEIVLATFLLLQLLLDVALAAFLLLVVLLDVVLAAFSLLGVLQAHGGSPDNFLAPGGARGV